MASFRHETVYQALSLFIFCVQKHTVLVVVFWVEDTEMPKGTGKVATTEENHDLSDESSPVRLQIFSSYSFCI